MTELYLSTPLDSSIQGHYQHSYDGGEAFHEAHRHARITDDRQSFHSPRMKSSPTRMSIKRFLWSALFPTSCVDAEAVLCRYNRAGITKWDLEHLKAEVLHFTIEYYVLPRFSLHIEMLIPHH